MASVSLGSTPLSTEGKPSYRGGMRSAPSMRVVSPFSIGSWTMCSISMAYSSGRPNRGGTGTVLVGELLSSSAVANHRGIE